MIRDQRTLFIKLFSRSFSLSWNYSLFTIQYCTVCVQCEVYCCTLRWVLSTNLLWKALWQRSHVYNCFLVGLKFGKIYSRGFNAKTRIYVLLVFKFDFFAHDNKKFTTWKIFVNLLNDKLSGTELIIISPFLPQHFDFKIHKLGVKLYLLIF